MCHVVCFACNICPFVLLHLMLIFNINLFGCISSNLNERSLRLIFYYCFMNSILFLLSYYGFIHHIFSNIVHNITFIS